MKSPAELTRAARLGVLVHVDSLTELRELLHLPELPGGWPPVGLRLATRGGDGAWSRLGLLPAEVERARELLGRAGLPVRSVHVGVATLSGPEAYREALVSWAEVLRSLAKAADGRLTVDVGGGFPPCGVPGRGDGDRRDGREEGDPVGGHVQFGAAPHQEGEQQQAAEDEGGHRGDPGRRRESGVRARARSAAKDRTSRPTTSSGVRPAASASSRWAASSSGMSRIGTASTPRYSQLLRQAARTSSLVRISPSSAAPRSSAAC